MRAKNVSNDSFFAEMKNDVFSLSTPSENPLADGWVNRLLRGPVCTERSEGRWGGSLLTQTVAGYHAVVRKREGRVAVMAALIHSYGMSRHCVGIGGPSARVALAGARTVWQAGRASLMIITSGRPTAPEASYTGCCGAWESQIEAAMIGGGGAV